MKERVTIKQLEKVKDWIGRSRGFISRLDAALYAMELSIDELKQLRVASKHRPELDYSGFISFCRENYTGLEEVLKPADCTDFELPNGRKKASAVFEVPEDAAFVFEVQKHRIEKALQDFTGYACRITIKRVELSQAG